MNNAIDPRPLDKPVNPFAYHVDQLLNSEVPEEMVEQAKQVFPPLIKRLRALAQATPELQLTDTVLIAALGRLAVADLTDEKLPPKEVRRRLAGVTAALRAIEDGLPRTRTAADLLGEEAKAPAKAAPAKAKPKPTPKEAPKDQAT